MILLRLVCNYTKNALEPNQEFFFSLSLVYWDFEFFWNVFGIFFLNPDCFTLYKLCLTLVPFRKSCDDNCIMWCKAYQWIDDYIRSNDCEHVPTDSDVVVSIVVELVEPCIGEEIETVITENCLGLRTLLTCSSRSLPWDCLMWRFEISIFW